ncbi:hypothetical protein SUGI_0983970 [Cryptomeria japonica]|nr:hypothetical protein SUGI_0983970 [Cryptomeria japonica]
MVSKVLRTLLPVYAIRVATIHELKSIDKTKVTLDSIIGKLIAFELNSFDESVQKSESAFRVSVSNPPVRKSREASHSHESRSNREVDDEESLIELEALLAKRLPRGIDKYKCKLPLKCFACNWIGHIAVNCPNGDNEHKHEKYKKYKGKGKRDCLIAVDGGITDEESEGDANEDIVFVAIKEETSDHKALVSCMDSSDDWLIESGCSHHMTSDRSKFLTLKEFDGGVVRFEMTHPAW